ncbi:hypothetical protein [Aureimonas psammosilenae]|uniref:hypothetical protein n=1 Tax=Aureimonas psammosilenae TaxID=2495496 RepID=UPI00126116A1|nr:hypothetical protein [Aureimonas psammosilenae]
MGKWLERALASVPLVPLAPIADRNEANGTIGTIGTTPPNESAAVPTIHDDDIEREERLAIYGEPQGEVAQERGERGLANFANPASDAVTRLAVVGEARSVAVHAGRFEDRPANWMPEPGSGVTILRPAAELPAIEYDMHLDRLIATLPAGSAEVQRLIFAKRKGWVVECEGRRIFTRGRF